VTASSWRRKCSHKLKEPINKGITAVLTDIITLDTIPYLVTVLI